jgi:hypothetical protein
VKVGIYVVHCSEVAWAIFSVFGDRVRPVGQKAFDDVKKVLNVVV